TGEDNFVCRTSGGPSAAQLSLGDDVHAGAHPCHGPEHRLVRVGLDGKADQVIGSCEGLGQHAVVPLQSSGGIAIEWSPNFFGDTREADSLGMENSAAITEVMHEFRAPLGAATGPPVSLCAGLHGPVKCGLRPAVA